MRNACVYVNLLSTEGPRFSLSRQILALIPRQKDRWNPGLPEVQDGNNIRNSFRRFRSRGSLFPLTFAECCMLFIFLSAHSF